MKKKGFFGGTFDPIHFGHLNLALQLQERCGLDEVYFCPARSSPLKTEQPPTAAAHHRREMVELAIAPIPSFKLLTLELDREGPSYTIDTIRALSREGEWYLILGEDVIHDFARWKEVEQLVTLARPLIGSRTSKMGLPIGCSPQLQKVIEKGTIKIPLVDISSTELRQRLIRGQYCGHLVPEPVLSYINQHALYR
jgi:nicotinate-nucleotide adenylyltransferase